MTAKKRPAAEPARKPKKVAEKTEAGSIPGHCVIIDNSNRASA